VDEDIKVLSTHTHLSVLKRDDTGVFGGADDVVIIADPLNGALSKTLNTVSLGGYTHTHTHTYTHKHTHTHIQERKGGEKALNQSLPHLQACENPLVLNIRSV